MLTKPCPIDGTPIEQRELGLGKGRQKIYCSRRCREAAARQRKIERGDLCSWPGCPNPLDANTWCKTHYLRDRNGLPMDAPIRPLYEEGQLCAWPTCDRGVVVGTYCDTHYRRSIGRSKVPMDAPIKPRLAKYPKGATCSWGDCLDPPVCDWLCSMHSQRQRNGWDMDAPRQRVYTPDDICLISWCPKQAVANDYCRDHAARDNKLITAYGLNIVEHQRILAEQGGVCAICGTSDPGGTATSVLGFSVDHDHWCCPGKKSCGKCVRALLCNSCNHGHFDDDSTLVRKRCDLNDAFRASHPWIAEKRAARIAAAKFGLIPATAIGEPGDVSAPRAPADPRKGTEQ